MKVASLCGGGGAYLGHCCYVMQMGVGMWGYVEGRTAQRDGGSPRQREALVGQSVVMVAAVPGRPQGPGARSAGL